MLRLPIARLPLGLVPTWTTMTKLFASWSAILAKMSASFRATVCRTFHLFSGQLRSRVLRCPQNWSFRCLMLTAKNISVFLLGSCQVLVIESFALSFCMSKIGSLIEWLLWSFCTDRENPMLRTLNPFSSCSDVDVLLHDDSVVQHHMVFLPPHG